MDPRRHSHAMKKALLDALAADAKIVATVQRFGVERGELREWLQALLREARAAGCPSARMPNGRFPWRPEEKAA